MRPKLKTDRYQQLWVVFSAIILIILTATSLSIGALAFIIFRSGGFSPFIEGGGGASFRPLGFLTFLSIAMGSSLSIFVSKKILSPISKLGKASREVAKGDFEITLDETSRIREINDMIRNFNFMVRELSRVETLRNDFLDNVSHEIRTPVSAIEGYAVLLRDKAATEAEKDEYIKHITDSARQLSQMSANILKLSKLENQEIVIDRKSYRLDEQLREAVLFLENRWSEKELEMDINLPKVTYFGSKELLTQVWLNLLDNAIKFTPPRGTIAVQLVKEQNDTVVSIRDSGRGMSQDELRHVFEKFYQGDAAGKETGNGLGLALVARIVDLCKGKVEVQSTSGGSIFTVTLPNEPIGM